MANKRQRKNNYGWVVRKTPQPNYQYAEDLDAFLSRYADVRNIQREARNRLQKLERDKHKLESMLQSGSFNIDDLLGINHQVPAKRKRTRSNNAPKIAEQQVPQPTIEPEPMDRSVGFAIEDLRTPESVMRDAILPSAKRINPFVTSGGAALDLQTPIMRGAVQVPQYGWGGWLPPICL